jgi:beta-lactam-binding protein with PASTA domain
LDVASFSNPDEDFTEGPTVSLEILAAALPTAEKKFPIWIGVVIAAIVLLVGGVLTWLLTRNKNRTVNQPVVASYKLPDVEDVGEEKAKQRLERECPGDQKPCVAVVVQRVVDDKIAKDRTIRTAPAAGTEVPLGSKVVLFTSLGPLVVPAVANQPAAAAEQRLREMCASDQCAVIVQQRNDEKVAKDIAIGTEPGENSKLKPGATVTLFISSGPQLIPIGKYMGMSPENAKAQIMKDGFTVGEINVVIVRDHRAGAVPLTAPIVWGQIPEAGTPQPKGAKISLQIREQ